MLRFLAFTTVLAALAVGCATTSDAPKNLHYQKFILSPDSAEQMLLTGPPQTGGMRSGRVVLKRGEEMHSHSTAGNEELLVFLQGKARVVLGTDSVEMEAGQALYIPPQTQHEVRNEGDDELRYIFTVAPAGR